MIPIAVRLHPGQDLLRELEYFCRAQSLDAGCVLTCVGSLTTAVIRFANQEQAEELHGHFEIVSLTGVLSTHGAHCHISISDREGRTVGGHLMAGCNVYTTAEIIIGTCPGMRFLRTFDPQTGYPELEIATIEPEEE
ncbi:MULTISPECIES: PPC domain-containing DNA-binding protein [unclassified Pseudodesulfovibrio]|uniref:PPC domain-containing DNA-binding protein n=1 Tax=unclassified Pseudodesulfovibrio TaxID=2661612 RepID=UPI000FEBC409|nr:MULTISPECIES: PPC domain-containing DNA-binding protein [unclassified Pseudodesulfovibrio]MCJ2163333.1 DNA-binding protein [Pseudodesulfovibrio sp. S3-i]RWU06573.1 DNA-binding protein [Pseudodesulfovibrio sp. S3]